MVKKMLVSSACRHFRRLLPHTQIKCNYVVGPNYWYIVTFQVNYIILALKNTVLMFGCTPLT